MSSHTRMVQLDITVEVPADGYDYGIDSDGRIEEFADKLLTHEGVLGVQLGGSSGSGAVNSVEPVREGHVRVECETVCRGTIFESWVLDVPKHLVPADGDNDAMFELLNGDEVRTVSVEESTDDEYDREVRHFTVRNT